ncbi:kinesin [Angomonas deanei]|nr:kinesin [Angomonas deanei]|eukprot:EPY20120.1 kinesin [Angomonas deanei]
MGSIYDVFRIAVSRRVQRATEANDTSSRSHAIFTLEVFQYPNNTENDARPSFLQCVAMREKYQVDSIDPRKAAKPFSSDFFPSSSNPLMGSKTFPVMHSKLTIVDLAGSEKSKHSNAKGEAFEQLKKINASLTALGNVVHALYENSKHIPYRDCKLTIVLRDSFAAPNARIMLIVNVSPTVLTVDESLSSLYFADKVKAIETLDAKTNPAQMKLESDYVASLHRRDALLADLHICAVENNVPLTTVRTVWAATCGCTPLHTNSETPDPAALRKASDKLKAISAAADAAERTKQELGNRVKERVKLDVQSYVEKRRSVETELATFDAEASKEERTHAERMKALNKALEAAKSAASQVQLQALTERRNKISEKVKNVAKEEEKLNNHLNSISNQFKDDEVRHSQLLTKKVTDVLVDQEKEWERCATVAKLMVQLSKKREELAYLLVDNYALSHNRDPPKRYRKRDVTLQEWMRHAVLAMAGNAVTISMKNSIKAARPDPANLEGIANLPVNHKGKYWTQQRLRQEKESSALPGTKKKKHTSFDDDSLMDTLMAYMDMGAILKRVGHTGSLRSEMFYVTRKDDRYRLCWDSIDRRKQNMGNLNGKDHLVIDQISQITLGQSSALFSKCPEAGPATAFCSFSVLYHDRKREVRCLDLICSTMAEMEYWVMGLSRLSGKWPLYEVSKSPEVDCGMGACTAPTADMTDEEAALCQEWFIPSSTLLEAKSQIQKKCEAKGKSCLSITPGELRRVTGLDIFRASALWVFLQRKEAVTNPLETLYCYIDPSSVKGGSTRTSAETAGVTEDVEERSEVLPF